MRLQTAVLVGIVGFVLACGGAATPDASVTPAASAVAVAPAGPAATAWDGQSTFVCTAMDKMTIRGVTAVVASGPAVRAGGMCELVIEDCDLSGATGIEVAGMAKVTMVRGRINGSEYSVYAGGESVTRLDGVAVSGPMYKAGMAVVEEGAAPAAAPARAAASAPVVAAPTATPAAATSTKSSGTASSAPKAAASSADAGQAALKKKCDGAYSKCKDSAYDARNSCQSGCVDSGTNTCNSSCESCQSSCVSTYNDKTSACERTWNSCY